MLLEWAKSQSLKSKWTPNLLMDIGNSEITPLEPKDQKLNAKQKNKIFQ